LAIIAGMTTDVIGFIACGCATEQAPLPGGLVPPPTGRVSDLPAGPLGTLAPQPAGAAAVYVPAAGPRNNPLATASFVCGLVPVLPVTIAAIVLGIQARRQVHHSGEPGAALATAGLALGVFWLLLTVVVLSFVL
jgi:hypothetical protein